MGAYLLLMSLFYMITGIVLILTPKKVVKMTQGIFKMKDPRLVGLIPLSCGILFLLSASSTVVGWLVVLMGLAGIAKAVYIFMTPVAKIKSHWWFSLSDNGYRGFGIIVLILGVILFLSRV